jgi:hypothetical protein
MKLPPAPRRDDRESITFLSFGLDRRGGRLTRAGEAIPTTPLCIETVHRRGFRFIVPVSKQLPVISDQAPVISQQIMAGDLVSTDSQVQTYGRFNGSGSLADLAALQITNNVAQSYMNAQPGSTLNLSTSEIAACSALQGGALQAVQQQRSIGRRVMADKLKQLFKTERGVVQQ